MFFLFLLLIGGFVYYIHTRPADFALTRSILIAAPAEKVFPLVSDFREWTRWSPWEHIDTDLTRIYGDTTQGVGGEYAWDGKKSGAGKMVFTESIPSEKISLSLEFYRPMKAINLTVFTFETVDAQTKVTWTMSGRHETFAAKVFGVLAMEKVVGKSFEQGLQKMKESAEK